VKRTITRYTDEGVKVGDYEVEVFQGNTVDKYQIFVLTWLPRAMESIKQFQQTIDFDQWVNDGYVTLTEGDTMDSHRVARDIITACKDLDVIQGGFDRRDADTVYRILLDTYGDIFFPQIQNAAHMNVAVKALENAVRNREISHQGNPLLAWQIGNVELWEDSSGYRWVHKTKSRDKIDGIVAILNGFKCIEEIIAGAKPRVNYDELIV
jgi:phage terminase large subunit-like protein